jgi:hypothetical protein
MITLRRIKVTVTTPKEEQFGFDFPFKEGLNILSGENSSGKSSVLAAIYYCLGMEQLLGGYNADIFRNSFTKEFEYDNATHQVFHSKAELHIENENKDVAIIHRNIVSQYKEEPNLLTVSQNNSPFETKFIHDIGDTDTDGGFYKWLIDFTGVELPIYTDKETGETKKILYLQHIFATCLVEQTKGWSDFFALLPNFTNTKKPKQKIIEYTLGLSNLSNEFKKDLLLIEEKEYKKHWTAEVKGFNNIAWYSNFYTPSLLEKYTSDLSQSTIDKFSLKRKYEENNTIINIEVIILRLENMLKELKEKNKINPTKSNANSNLLEKQSKLKNTISLLNKQLENIIKEYHNEKLKRENYRKRLTQITKEIRILENMKKVDKLSELTINDVENCPVCNSVLTIKNQSQLKNHEKITSSESILFYKSEKSLYETYLNNSDKLMQRFKRTKSYYKDKISIQNDELNIVYKQLVADERIPSKSDISEEIKVEYELRTAKKINEEFNSLKKNLIKIANILAKIHFQKKRLKQGDSEDKNKINSFKREFQGLLGEFKYDKSIADRVQIPSQLIPIVKEGIRTPFPMRSKASASEFIRALWAFYLTLLIKGENHLGLLILDEPGQHAMKLREMRTLIKLTSKMKDKQIILAISNDKTKEKTKYALDELLEGFRKGVDYSINIIKDNGRDDKSIQPL